MDLNNGAPGGEAAGEGAGTAIDGGAAAALGGGEGAAGGGDGAGAAGQDEGSGGGSAGWLELYSAQGGEADAPSNRDWLQAKQFNDPDAVIHSYRELEKQFRDSGKLVIPGEGAKPEELQAFHKAIGVPEKADGYEVKVPEGAEIDTALLDRARAAAHKAGAPKGAFEAIAAEFVAHQGEQIEAYNSERKAETDEYLKGLGAQKDVTIQYSNNAMRTLGLSQQDVAALEFGFHYKYPGEGPKRTFELLKKLGEGMAEDSLIHGGVAKKFGLSGEEAQAELDRLNSNAEWRAKITAGDKAELERRERLINAVAAAQELKQRQAAAS